MSAHWSVQWTETLWVAAWLSSPTWVHSPNRRPPPSLDSEVHAPRCHSDVSSLRRRSAMSLRKAIDRAPMSRFQALVVVLLCLVMNVVGDSTPGDGDRRLRRGGGVAPSGLQIGLLLSSGLIGSTLVAPLADRVGRRPLIVACLGGATIGMVPAAGPHDRNSPHSSVWSSSVDIAHARAGAPLRGARRRAGAPGGSFGTRLYAGPPDPGEEAVGPLGRPRHCRLCR